MGFINLFYSPIFATIKISNTKMKKIVTTISFILFYFLSNAQSIAINTDGSTANATSILDVKSTTKGILIPRMSKVEKNAIVLPANGLVIYQNAPDSVGFHYYNGTVWVWLQNSNEGWSLNGNDNVTALNFLGSINNNALRFRINNKQSGIIDSSYQNTSLGYQSLINTINNGNNTAIGFDAGKSLSTGYGNALLGNKTLAASINGSENVAIGDSAMGNAINSSSNTAVGYYALKSLDGQVSQSFNTAIGYRSQSFQTGTTAGFLADNNTSVGSYAMEKNVTGNRNVAIGRSAMRNVDSSSGNVAIGNGALFQNNRTDFSQNVAIGSFALNQDLDGIWNTVIGGDAMAFTQRSSLNSVVGFRSLKSILDGGENNTLGVGTMEYKDTALSCVAIGRFALSGHPTNDNLPDTGSIAIGTRAGRYNNVSYNTFIGYESGIGSAGATGMTGKEIVSIGSFSLNKLSTGSSNSTFGYAALFNNTTGNGNIGVGTRSLFQNRTGKYNVAIGDSALYGSASNIGDRNIAVGSYTLKSVSGLANNNVAIGDSAAQRIVDGTDNIAIGSDALSQNVLGIRNVAIGAGALYTNFNSANVAIGYNAGYNEGGGGKLYIENSNADKNNALIYGDFDNDSLNLNAKVNIKNYTRLGQQTDGAPAIKMKKLIIPVGPAVDGFQSYPMGSGITDAKVIGAQIFVIYASPWKIPASYRDAAGYEFNYQVQANNIVIINKAGNSANIGTKPFTVLITYEE
jgi:trimeric autotransporter adhesin